MIYYKAIKNSVLGTIFLCWDHNGRIIQIRLSSKPETGEEAEVPETLVHVEKFLENHIDGEVPELDKRFFDLTWIKGFAKTVYGNLMKLRKGETITYGELAIFSGSPKAARAVGSIMNKNRFPLVIPCHRVLGTQGRLVGFASGLDNKQKLLEAESAALK